MKPDTSHFDRPRPIAFESFDNAEAAVERLELIYDLHTAFIRERFAALLKDGRLEGHVRATYPEVRIETSSYAKIDSRLSYGHVAGPGFYATTITQPRLFRSYLTEQIRLLIRHHGLPVEVGPSREPIPLHFAFMDTVHVEGEVADRIDVPLRDMFDVPDLAVMDDAIVNGTFVPKPGEPLPLAPFTAPRVDYSVHRLPHYTATQPEHFQNFVLFTNYQFYVDGFREKAHRLIASGEGGYESFVEPGNV
ncbi:MAG: AMP nucleosidase, partial [Bauldia sp.]